MSGTFVSPLFIGGEILLGLSLTVFVGAWIANLGDRAHPGRR
jgi:hypothetical protein